MNRKLIPALAIVLLMYSATARSQEIHTTMATIEGEDGYTMSGNTWCGRGEATSTIKPGERFIARELSYTIKDLEVYPPANVRRSSGWGLRGVPPVGNHRHYSS